MQGLETKGRRQAKAKTGSSYLSLVNLSLDSQIPPSMFLPKPPSHSRKLLTSRARPLNILADAASQPAHKILLLLALIIIKVVKKRHRNRLT
jgi:hypothetical protein